MYIRGLRYSCKRSQPMQKEHWRLHSVYASLLATKSCKRCFRNQRQRSLYPDMSHLNRFVVQPKKMAGTPHASMDAFEEMRFLPGSTNLKLFALSTMLLRLLWHQLMIINSTREIFFHTIRNRNEPVLMSSAFAQYCKPFCQHDPGSCLKRRCCHGLQSRWVSRPVRSVHTSACASQSKLPRSESVKLGSRSSSHVPK